MTTAFAPHRPPAGADAADQDVQRFAPMLTGGRALALAPVSAATWTGAGQVVVAAGLSLVAATVLVSVVATAVSLVPIVVGAPLLAVSLLLCRGYGHVERARLRAQLGADVPAPTPARRDVWQPRAWLAHARDVHAWTALAHAVVAMLLTWTAASLALGLASAVLLAPVAAVTGRPPSPHVALTALVVPVAAWGGALVLQLTTLAQVRLARALLGGPSRGELERAARAAEQRAHVAEDRAEHLRVTRSAAVAAADEERRRIERDLHDGAQQRLVALGVELGAARRAAAQDPAVAVAALEAAHGEVKEVLAELRDLVRGVHPAVLTDRGLDAALSALAARSPVPVVVDVDVPDGSVGPQTQAAAYFVVAEALTNVAKHAAATRAGVCVDVRGERLHLEVSDDGAGAAQPAPGGGLDGLRRRVEALDGTFTLTSPAGAGTVLTVEVPCAS